MFDKIALPKASSVYDDRKYSNDFTSFASMSSVCRYLYGNNIC